MTTQFGRIVNVVIDAGDVGIALDTLRVEFEVKASRNNYPNDGTVKIYNLSRATRAKIKDGGKAIEVRAGYGDNVGIILNGNIRTVAHTKSGQDIITTITCAEGDEDHKNAMTNVVHPAGSKPTDMIKNITGTFKDSKLGAMVGLDKEPASRRAVVQCGNAKDQLNKLGKKHNFEWAVQNGAIEVVRNDLAINDVTVLSSTSGLLGSAVVTEKGIKVKCLLNPRIKPNRVIQVISEYAEADAGGGAGGEGKTTDTDIGAGFYRVDQVAYSGNNRDGEFVCNVEGTRYGMPNAAPKSTGAGEDEDEDEDLGGTW